MASYSNFGSDYFITFNNGTGTVHVAGNLEVSGNVTYISELSVNDAFIIAGANNSSSANVTSVGFLAGKPTNPISYAGIKYNATADAWQISTDVLSNGTANTVPYANISTSTYGDANVSSLLSAYGSNIISSTGNITTTANISGDYILGNGSQLTGVVSSYGDANVVNLMSNFASNNISMTGNITTGNVTVSANIVSNNLEAGNVITNLLRSDDSTYLTVEDGLNVTGDIESHGNVTANHITVITLVTTPVPLADLVPQAGARAFVNDGNITAANNFGNIIGNGGGNVVSVWSDGSNWYVG